MTYNIFAWVSIYLFTKMLFFRIIKIITYFFNKRINIFQGTNSAGQLSLGYKCEECLVPQKVSIPSNIDPSKILKIVGGACHTIFLTDEACYSCGSNKNGQLGNSSTEDSLNFIKVHIPEEETIIDVTCSWNSCMALTESGNVYVWGSNLNGQLGLEMSVKSMNKPFKLNLEEKVVKFAMGLRHSALITENGLLLVSGAQTNGQLGFSYSSKPDVRCIYNFVRGKISYKFYQFKFYNRQL